MRLRAIVEKELHRRVVKNFLDVLILSKLENSKPMSGYDFINFIYEEFGIFISSGTLYSSLYAMEREGFISGYLSRRKRVYKITEKGREFADATRQAVKAIHNLIEEIVKVKSPR